MPTYRVTGPDGRTYMVTPPEGENPSQEEILQRVKDQVARSEAMSSSISAESPWMGAAKEAAREILPGIGMTVGAALGLPVGLAPLGAGLGYATGRLGNELIGGVSNLLSPPPNPHARPQAASGPIDVARDVAIGKALHILPEHAIRGLKAAGTKLAGSMLGLHPPTAEDIAVREAAQRLGITLPAGASSGSVPVSLIEGIPSRFPIGVQSTREMAEKVRGQSKAAAENISTMLGLPHTIEEAGITIKEEVGDLFAAKASEASRLVENHISSIGARTAGLLDFGKKILGAGEVIQKARRKAASSIYDSALGPRKLEEVRLGVLQQTSSEMVAEEARRQGVQSGTAKTAAGLKRASSSETPDLQVSDLPDAAIRDLIASGRGRDVASGGKLNLDTLSTDFIEKYGLHRDPVGSRTLEEAVDIQQRLRALARKVEDDVEVRRIKRLMDAVTADIEAHVGADTSIAEAARYYRDEVAAYFAKDAPIRKLLNQRPGKVAAQILETKNLDLIKDVVEVFPGEQRQQLQQALLTKIANKSRNDITGEINPKAFLGRLNHLGDEALGIIFGDQMPRVSAIRDALKPYVTPDKTLRQILQKDPGGLIPSLVKGDRVSITKFQQVWDVISPSARSEARSALFSDVLEHAIDPATGEFSIQRAITAKEKIPQGVWDLALSGNPSAALRDLELVFRRLNAYSRWISNPSQTGAAILGPAQILGAMHVGAEAVTGVINPLKVFSLLSPYGLGVLVTSKAGQRLLTSRAPKPVDQFGKVISGLRIGGAAVTDAYTDPAVKAIGGVMGIPKEPQNPSVP